MKAKILLAAAAVSLTACNAQVKPAKAIPEQNHKLTLKPHIYNYNPETQNRVDMTVSTIETTHFTTDDNMPSWYYTIYAIDTAGNIYCIADDLEISNIAGYEFMTCLNQKVMLIYDKDKPDYTGYILPLNDWNN